MKVFNKLVYKPIIEMHIFKIPNLKTNELIE